MFLRNEFDKFNEYTKSKNQTKKEEKELTYKSANKILKGRHKILNSFESKIFPKGNQALERNIYLKTY